ncbi:MAG: prolipoprotein diacylglyceryl transferase [Candidatus Krumholzibacteria bacterium]|nr:prolipoprotein diacylglyceryl transferase [Candidatus Krumholzibacteria bacterium]MDH4336067.1 prolipoprotein diacylglyceryl transferase [Candidatus Krumholzibacteria bacterium]MDH5268357.1 prolipoprotein diacylglyceryl transferase [Candidatus Krumholzibacteria bacterium]MDH5626703.1 prolipoprotein diacylglyceryl transferase [Candidatus Krumholzibacteria bacterium]
MHPILLDLGRFQIRAYGFMLAVSFLLGIWYAGRRARKYGVDPQKILDLSVIIILAAVVGSRLLYVVFHLEQYANPLEMFALWQGGATFYGGFLLALAASWWWVQKNSLNFLTVADVVSPSIALGLVFTRVGCLMSGCCFGKPTDHAWGLVFPPDSPAGAAALEAASRLGLDHVALHPTQAYASAMGLTIFIILLALQPALTRRGSTFGLFLILYGIGRFTIDFFRFYEENARVLMGLSFNQVISIGLVAIGLVLLLRREKAPAPA